MARAFLLIRLTLVLVGGLAAAGIVSAGDGRDSGRQSTNTFVMVATPATAPSARVGTPSAGASIAPKSVVSNPYHVPMLQNAGSLRSSR